MKQKHESYCQVPFQVTASGKIWAFICKGSRIRPLYDHDYLQRCSSSDGHCCTGKLQEFLTFYREMTKKNYKCQNLLNSSILHQTDECQECDVAEYGEEYTSAETEFFE